VTERYSLSDLRLLEAESVHIIREVVAEFERPVMLYSVGKDSSVMVWLATKAFYPGPIPFPLLHVDTGMKFPEMYAFRDRFVADMGAKLIVQRNEAAVAAAVDPVSMGTVKCCASLKTEALLDSLSRGEYDAAFGGGRREEERSRAKERIYSFRDKRGQWDPKRQRPELWSLYNGKIDRGESIRAFPLSNWTELDIWQYIHIEKIPVVPLYFAASRPVVERAGRLIPVLENDPARYPAGTTVASIRYRSLGCHPCTGAIRSTAATVSAIVEEMMTVRTSERGTRVIDHDREGSMEEKKMEGYF
jgi:sulfate adenylyltransferase subunit 2